MACYDVQASQCKRGSGIPVVAFYESSGWTTPPVLPLDLENVIDVATDADDIPAADIPEKGDTTAAVGRAGDELTEDLHQHKSVMSVSDMVKAFGRKPVGGLGAGIDFDSQEDPTAEAFSPEERAALAAMEALLPPDILASTDEETRLICLRGRKYDSERAALLLPHFIQVRQELFGSSGRAGGGGGAGAASAEKEVAMRRQLARDVGSLKLVPLGKLPSGHTLLAMRLRLHDPNASSPVDMARLFYTTIMATLRADVDAQRHGVCILGDQTGIGLKNMDARTLKFIFGSLLPRLPVRLAKIVVFNLPWILGKVVMPIFLSLVSKKLRKRITIISSKDPHRLHALFPPSALPDYYAGSFPFDGPEYVQRMLALEI